MTKTALALLLGVPLVGACIRDPEHPPEPGERTDVMTVTPNLDLMFVIDDSPTMADKQNSLQRAFPALLAELAATEGGLPNLHLGIVSSDLGAKGAADATPGPAVGTVGQGGCGGVGKDGLLQLGSAVLANDDDTFLIANRDGSKNFTGELPALFSQMSSLGALGCGFEQQLGAIQRALENPENSKFSRAGANLGVVVLSDEDDCSIDHSSMFAPESADLGPLSSFRCFRFGVTCDQDPTLLGAKTNCHPNDSSQFMTGISPIADFLAAQKPDPRRVMFGAIVGTTDRIEVATTTTGGNPQPQEALIHSCTYRPPGAPADIGADPGIRFAALAGEFAGPSVVESICADDLTNQAASIGRGLAKLMSERCLPRAVEAATCVVEEHRDADPAFARTLQLCDGGVGANCFRIVDDSSCEHQRLEIDHPVPGPDDVVSVLRCE